MRVQAEKERAASCGRASSRVCGECVSTFGAFKEDGLSFIHRAHLHGIEAHLRIVTRGATLFHFRTSECSHHRCIVVATGTGSVLGADAELLIGSVGGAEAELEGTRRAAQNQIGIGQIEDAACRQQSRRHASMVSGSHAWTACESSTQHPLVLALRSLTSDNPGRTARMHDSQTSARRTTRVGWRQTRRQRQTSSQQRTTWRRRRCPQVQKCRECDFRQKLQKDRSSVASELRGMRLSTA